MIDLVDELAELGDVDVGEGGRVEGDEELGVGPGGDGAAVACRGDGLGDVGDEYGEDGGDEDECE